MSTAAADGFAAKVMHPASCSSVKGDTAEADCGNVQLAVWSNRSPVVIMYNDGVLST